MEVATKIILSAGPKDAEGNAYNPLDAKLASLELESISVVDKQSSEFQIVSKYAQDTNAGIGGWHTHKMTVSQVFRIERYEGSTLTRRLVAHLIHRRGEMARWEAGGWSDVGQDQKLVRAVALLQCLLLNLN